MDTSDRDDKLAAGRKKGDTGSAPDPEWATGLKRLYNSVVEEPLPDSFKDLLSKLDDQKTK